MKRAKGPESETLDPIARRRAAQRKYTDRKTREGQEIGKIPKVKDPARRAASMAHLQAFCDTYFSAIFFLKWSRRLLQTLRTIEIVVISHDKVVIIMPRGSGKSALCKVAALWAILALHHKYVILIGAVAADATDSLTWFKRTLGENKKLREDFPEVCYPIYRLGGETRKCMGQLHNGQRTAITWSQNRIILPTIAGSPYSGCVIDTASMEGHIRGRWVVGADGAIWRPTLALTDDPQTAESARSQGPTGQTTYRLKTINQDVQGLAGPDAQTAILVPCTMIEPDDLACQLADHSSSPDFRVERTKRLYEWPRNKALWEEYRQLREEELLRDVACPESTEFYRSRMATCGRSLEESGDCDTCERSTVCMDCGAVVDWAARTDDPRNLSAVQAAMHSFYKYGPAGFACEFQGEPLTGDGTQTVLTAAACRARFSGRKRGEVPLEAAEVTMFVDVQQSSLWWVIVAWLKNFTGHVIDYGVFPPQSRREFKLADIVDSQHNLQALFPGRSVEGTIQAGLEALVSKYLAMSFPRAGSGGAVRIGKLLVDSGKWGTTVAAVKHRVGGSTMDLSKGVGIKAGNKPMSSLRLKPWQKRDPGGNWYMADTKGTREFPHVTIDTNFWKSFVHAALLAPPGDPGAMTLFGDDPETHSLFASHITAETFTVTSGHGRDVQEWKIRPTRPDNHWLDCLVGCAVAASMLGITSVQLPRRRVVARRPAEQVVDGSFRPELG